MPAKAGIRSSQNIMPTFLNAMWLPWHGLHVNPPEILEQWGNFVSWEHIVGTGAYMIKEYAPGSYISYAKNPNYWAMDPVFPGYKLPYADELKGLIIEDAGTRLAAFRTGQVDWIREVPAKDAQAILERNPEVKYLKVRGWDGFHLSMNQKVPPFEKLEVRKALQMSIDRETIAKGYFKGFASPRIVGIYDGYVLPWIESYSGWERWSCSTRRFTGDGHRPWCIFLSLKTPWATWGCCSFPPQSMR